MSTLVESLSNVLPEGAYDLLCFESSPFECKNLINSSSQAKETPVRTIKVKHFISLLKSGLPLVGIEIYQYLSIFESHVQRYVFVSKVDTTGFSPKGLRIGKIMQVIVKYFITLDVKRYGTGVKPRKSSSEEPDENEQNYTIFKLKSSIRRLQNDPSYFNIISKYKNFNAPSGDTITFNLPQNVQTSISLFTRAEPQYLYPNSAKNSGKHVIDGNVLLNWWVATIDKALPAGSTNWDCKLIVPGSDFISTTKRLPRSTDSVSWSIGSIFDTDQNSLAIHQIPLFPDDPKGRFLEHLVVENRYKQVYLKDFWEELGFRQEFRLGNVVGIIGCREKGFNDSHGTHSSHEAITMSLKGYKKIMQLIKGVDYSNISDVRGSYQEGLQVAMEEVGIKSNFYRRIYGRLKEDKPRSEPVSTQKSHVGNSTASPATVNDLSGLVKRRKAK
ncbi:Piso0_003453 [Millerozyma farinosa CBS 7064]|uniref:histone acetyltransferase n=1 Tax=Pichia sorbitophila (strain ATCC MYA-4447 / BCRC 22081 / CBS 7064 / NBRC 10061 / NRRL Y-12695) TaxID=559304 RepID=G8YJ42_PICSO|nr:Piso0_003453 [Millerozyma farinosa CBS 7064]CCE81102.1 Piso0_003453 [Millerozyma farinosa CBS 7064]